MNNLKKQTVEHYDRLLACETPEQFMAEGWEGSSCPLCTQYRSGPSSCMDCPVFVRTGRTVCGGTDWAEMNVAILDFSGGPTDATLAKAMRHIANMREVLVGLDYTG